MEELEDNRTQEITTLEMPESAITNPTRYVGQEEIARDEMRQRDRSRRFYALCGAFVSFWIFGGWVVYQNASVQRAEQEVRLAQQEYAIEVERTRQEEVRAVEAEASAKSQVTSSSSSGSFSWPV